MKLSSLTLAFAFVVLLPSPAQSQSLVGTYYSCSTAYEGEADALMNTVFADVYQSYVDKGQLTNWGWVEHTAGGPWRRITTITAEDRSTVMATWRQIDEQLEEEHPTALRRFNEICDSHDDYIWTLADSYEGTDPGGTVPTWLSVYFMCDPQNEARADELMAELSTVTDKHVAAGHLSGWAWYKHDIGGRFRRLWTLLGAEGTDVIDALDMVTGEFEAEQTDTFAEFRSICSSHVDYIWADARTAGEG